MESKRALVDPRKMLMQTESEVSIGMYQELGPNCSESTDLVTFSQQEVTHLLLTLTAYLLSAHQSQIPVTRKSAALCGIVGILSRSKQVHASTASLGRHEKCFDRRREEIERACMLIF
jgi:hypothetical protein